MSRNQWDYTLTGGERVIIWASRPITEEQAREILVKDLPGAVVVSVKRWESKSGSVWDGRNVYRDAFPEWWELLYGRKQT